MKSSWWWVASLAAPALGKLNLVQRDLPAVVEMSTQRNPSVNPVARDQRRRMRRDNTVSVTLDNEVRLQFVFFFSKRNPPSFLTLTGTSIPTHIYSLTLLFLLVLLI